MTPVLCMALVEFTVNSLGPVNYRRAINRAETDPRVSQEHLTLPCHPLPHSSGPGRRKRAASRRRSDAWRYHVPPAGPFTVRATTICLPTLGTSTFCQFSRSEQSCAVPIWEKQDAVSRFTSPLPLRLVSRSPFSSRAPSPSGSAAVRAAAAHGQPDRLTLPRATAELEARHLSWASRWGCPQPWGWGVVTICGPGWAVPRVAKVVPWVLACPSTLGVELLGSTGPGLLLQELRGQPLEGVSLRSGWVCAEVAGELSSLRGAHREWVVWMAP